MIFSLSLVERIVAFGLGSAVQTSCEQQQNLSNLHALLLCGVQSSRCPTTSLEGSICLGSAAAAAVAALTMHFPLTVSGRKIYVYT